MADGQGANSEEAMLVERLKRVADTPAGFFAVHIHLSRLRPGNRQPHFLDIAKRTFDGMVMNSETIIFGLQNGDVVVICRNVPIEDMDTPIEKVRALFKEDPLTAVDETGLEDRFTTWYDLASREDLITLQGEAEKLLAESLQQAKKPQAAQQQQQAEGTPLGPANLAQINRNLQGVRIADLIREQTAVRLQAGGRGEIVFRENFIAMTELKERVAPDVNLFASAWLFQYLTETLDRRILSIMSQRNFQTMKDPISLNLNIGTVLSREFQTFHQNVGDRASMIVVEMQVIDIFADMNTFTFARRSLQEKGYRVLVDGLNPLSLHFFDPGLLEADFIKIGWGPEFAGDTPESRLAEAREAIAHAGKDAVILSRVGDGQAIRWGQSLGITRFQGYFIDRLINAKALQFGTA